MRTRGCGSRKAGPLQCVTRALSVIHSSGEARWLCTANLCRPGRLFSALGVSLANAKAAQQRAHVHSHECVGGTAAHIHGYMGSSRECSCAQLRLHGLHSRAHKRSRRPFVGFASWCNKWSLHAAPTIAKATGPLPPGNARATQLLAGPAGILL